MALYTPFFERNTEKYANALMQRRTGDLAQRAYMGDPAAMGQLYSMNPAMAMGIEENQMRKQAFHQNTEAAQAEARRQQQQDAIDEEERAREWYESRQAILDPIIEKAGQFATLEEFQTYAKAAVGEDPESIQRIDNLDQNTFESLRTAAPADDGGLADQRERKIDQYMSLFGMSREEAVQAVDTDVMMDDKGNFGKYNPITQEFSYITPEEIQQSPAPNAQFNTQVSDLAFDPGKGTGFAAATVGLWNSTLGQIPFLPIGEETAQVAQNLRVLERDAIRALASSGRPPVVEQERIASIIPEAMAWTQNPQEAQLKMTNFVDLMMQQYIDDIRFAGNPRNAESLRDEATRRASEIESIMNRVLKPEAVETMFAIVGSSEEARGRVYSVSDAELLQMDAPTDPVELDFYMERLRQILGEDDGGTD